MLLKELRSIKKREKEKVKDYNKNFNRILNKFPSGTQSHNSITIDYYTTAFPTIISQFMKRVTKETLALNFTEVIIVDKDLRMIGVITDDDESKDSKETSRKSEPSSSKAKEKESSDIKSLTKMVKTLTSEILEIKKRSNNTSTSNKPPKSFPFQRSNNNINNQPTKSAQSSNVVMIIDPRQFFK